MTKPTFRFHCFGACVEGAWPPGAAGGAGVATFGAAAPDAAAVVAPPPAEIRFHIDPLPLMLNLLLGCV